MYENPVLRWLETLLTHQSVRRNKLQIPVARPAVWLGPRRFALGDTELETASPGS